MARIQLRDTKIYLQDGLSGTASVNDASGIVDTDTDIDIDFTGSDDGLNTDDPNIVPIGARFTIAGGDGTVYTVTGRTPASGGPTTNIVWTPAVDSNNTASDDAVLTFLPQLLEIQIGDGDLSWTETREFNYDLDRGQLDTVRQGDDQPVEVELAFTFEYVTTESGKTVTPVDALKRTGEASEWVSSSADACEPYAVDIYAVHCISCGSDQDQDFLMSDFRWESLDYSVADASISVSGRCNITDVTSTRSASFDQCS